MFMHFVIEIIGNMVKQMWVCVYNRKKTCSALKLTQEHVISLLFLVLLFTINYQSDQRQF